MRQDGVAFTAGDKLAVFLERRQESSNTDVGIYLPFPDNFRVTNQRILLDFLGPV